jgi:peptidoglycan/xylan/chitin deacetylase (PgdA/CDA1 family)
MDRRSFLRTAGLVAGGAAVGAVAVDVLQGRGSPAATAPGANRAGLTGTGLDAPRVFSRVQTGDQLVALTLDDGPAATTTAVLKLLHDKQVPATFDVVGNRLQQHTELLRQMNNDLHDIGNHTWSHRVLAGLTAADIDPELRKTDELIQNITGDRPRYVRPPGGEVTPELLTVASEFGYDVLLWSVQLHVPVEASAPSPSGTAAPTDPVQYVLDNLQPGAIILAHDLGSLSGTASGDALPRLIDGARAKGYRFLTVSQLVAAGTPLQGDAV